jgi:hypothetical protein
MYETGKSSWVNKLLRKDGVAGKVVSDWNDRTRRLTVKMDDGTTQVLELNNIGPDEPAVHDWEWYETRGGRWYRF